MKFKFDENDKTITASILAILIALGVTVNSLTKKSERINAGQEHNEYIDVENNYVVPTGYALEIIDGQTYGARNVVTTKLATGIYENGRIEYYVTNNGKLVLGNDGQYYEVFVTKEYVNAIEISDDNTLKLSK